MRRQALMSGTRQNKFLCQRRTNNWSAISTTISTMILTTFKMAVKTRAQLIIDINNIITSNANNEITGALLNQLLIDIADSSANLTSDDTILAGLSEFDTGRNYAIGECVVFDSKIYQSSEPISAGAFDINQWFLLTATKVPEPAEVAPRSAAKIRTTAGCGVDCVLKDWNGQDLRSPADCAQRSSPLKNKAQLNRTPMMCGRRLARSGPRRFVS